MSVRSSSALSRLLLASVSAATLAAPALAASPSESEAIIVIGEKEAETGYKVTDTVSAMRTNTPLVDTPQSITIVTAKQIEDQAANSIGDAVRYTPGIYSAQGEGNRETLVIRGMTTTGDFFVDGIRDDVQTYRDLYNIQRLEVFRGSNAMTFGRGGTGGLINRVTKVAGWETVRDIRVEGGMYQHYRGQFDLGGAVSDAVALRVTGVYQNSESYRDGVNYERLGINPTASLRIGPDTLIQVGYEHFKDERIADRGVPSLFRPATATGSVGPLETPRGQFFGDPEGSPTSTNTDAGNLYISHDFSDTVSIRNRTRYADYDKFYQNVFTTGFNTGTLNNTGTATGAPGLPVGSYAAGTVFGIQAYNQATKRKNLINQTDLNAEFDTGGIKHTLLLGAEFAKQKTDNIRLEGLFPQTVATAAGGTATTNAQTTYVRLANSRIRRPDIVWQPLASSGTSYGTLAVSAGYIQDQIELMPQFEVVLGVRYEHLVTKVTDRRTVGFPATQRRDFKTTDNLWSPRVGLIFKPVESASLYASFSRSYLPRGGDQLAGLSLANETLNPERYQNYELGAKWDINPGFNVSAAIYQLDRDNVIVLIDPNNPAAGTELGGGQRSKGFELGMAGKVTPQLSVTGAYTYQDAVFTKAISASVRAGAEIPNAPRHSASLWGRYDVTPEIGLALGANYQGSRYAAQDNLVKLPGFTRFDAALFYKITENIDVQVNIENLFNKRYYPFAHSNTNITPGSPTSARGAINVKF